MNKDTKFRINIIILIALLSYVTTMYIMMDNARYELQQELERTREAVEDYNTAVVEIGLLEQQIQDLQKEIDELIIEKEGIE